MSEVIEDYIRRNTGMKESDAFDGFLGQERIRAWVGDDDSRKERLRREFSRVWASLHPPSTTSRQGSTQRDARPTPTLVSVPVQRAPAPAPPVEAPKPDAPPRLQPAKKMQVLCPTCGKLDVYNVDGKVECRHCRHSYEDMLELIPVQPVGPFTFLFGQGASGWLTATGVVVSLVLLYGVFRWL